MASNNKNWDQDWRRSSNRYGGNRYEGNRSEDDWFDERDRNRYEESNERRRSDYGQGSTYGENSYDDRNRYSGHGGFGDNYSRDYNRGSQRGGSSSYGDSFYDQQNSSYNSDYNQGGYGTGYYGSGYTGGYRSGSSGSGRYNRRGEGYGGGFGFGERSNFGDRNYDRRYGYSNYRDGQRNEEWPGSSNYRNQPSNDERNWWDKTTDEVSSWFGDEEAERRRRQDRMHKGRGPKNYTRSDERIKEDINDKLSDDWFIDASEVDVAVSNGEVTLTGTVDDRATKRRAEDIAETVSGVKHVENRLRVSTSQTSSSSYTTTPGATSIGTGTGSMSGTNKGKSSYAETK